MKCCALLIVALALGATVANAQAMDNIVGDVQQAVGDAVNSVTGAANEVMDMGPERESVADVLDNKNDTSILWTLVQSAGFEDTLSETNLTATVFAPLDKNIQEELAANPALAALADDEEAVAEVLSYHVVLGEALTLDQLTDGLILQTMVDGPEGQLKVVRPAGAAKPRLLTTSGQRVPIYQYDLMGGDAIVHTIRGLLISGNQTFAAPAPAPMM